MKTRLTWLLATIVLLSGPLSLRAGESSDAQRVVALLDYVGGDYGRAVQQGRIVSDVEYQEQLRFLADARRLALPLLGREGGEVLAALDVLESRVRALAAADDVADAARAARDVALRRFGLTTVPPARPSLARAQALYQQNCATCHGARGDADTPVSATLDPAPASFREPERRAALSPYRVYNTLSFGVPGTAMPSFASLSLEDRWSIAFYVFRLGHADTVVASADAVPATTLGTLAARSDGELLEDLRTRGDAAAVVAAWRRNVPFEEPPAEAAFRRTRELVEGARRLAARDPEGADRMVLDAYLQGFEPVEARLSARDPRRVAELERHFADLRTAIASRLPGEVDRAAARLLAALARAESPEGTTLPFVAAFLIFFREGVEAALLVGALLAGVRRLGRPEAARSIHAGWILAIVAGGLTWWTTESLFAGAMVHRETLEAAVSLVAAAVLFLVSFWLISRVEARRWTDYLREQLAGSLDGRRHVLVTVAFLAAYREAAETILFTRALLLEGAGHESQVWAGAALGCLAFVAAAAVLRLTVLRLPIGPFFAVSSAILCVLAVTFAGNGLQALVATGVLAPHPVDIPNVGWLGIHPDLAIVLVQLAMVAVIGVGAIVAVVRSRRRAATAS